MPSLLITSTDTEVGKTFTTCALIESPKAEPNKAPNPVETSPSPTL
jgi:dethiobiotin synthetase